MERLELAEKIIGLASRVTNSTYMELLYAEMGGHEITDDEILYSFMGGGGSDMVTVGEFREFNKALLEYNALYRKAVDG
jgi:hypothetical protein